jgi:hypothetical protein
MHFYVETKKTLVTKVVGHAKMNISTKNGTMVPYFAMELKQTMLTWYKSKRTPARKQLFVKSSPVNPWHGMFGIFS